MTNDPPRTVIPPAVFQERRLARIKSCHHRRFVLDRENQTVECADCGEQVSAFLACSRIAMEETTLHERFRVLHAEIAELRSWKPWLRAVKALERTWRGRMLPQCPHCRRGITAEALASTGCVSRDVDRERAAWLAKDARGLAGNLVDP